MSICVLQFLLGIWASIFDSSLNFKNHINSVVKTCNYHIRNLYSILSRATKGNSNPRLKGNRKGIIVKGKEFYIPILNTFPTR